MKEKIIFNAGYTVRCVSWENDGDNYGTKDLTVPTLEMALELKELCLLCRSKNRDRSCLGNTYDGYTKSQIETITEFVKEHKLLFPDVDDTYDEDDDFIDSFNEKQWDILGRSEDFECRVCETVEIFYSDKDIYAQVIE